jgi:dipeptidyl aminopeptidase/acylaminoacyl peptidase
MPELPLATINIPWEVSRGYLVLMVDINYSPGLVGQCTLSSVNGALDQLSKRNYVDSNRRGVIGHSFGGFETNYLITHSNKFACAITSSGASSMITSTVNLTISHGSIMDFTSYGQYRMGKDLWSDKKGYLDNSPLMNADKVTCPLLMMANKADGIINFSEGIAMYQSFKRIGKPVWLLQYDDGKHILTLEADLIDRLKKFDQFFDHYLKNAPAPDWMVNGIPARYKGQNN